MRADPDPAPRTSDREGDDRYQSGETIAGKYRLVRPLGRGAVGRVWVAHNEVLDVHVGLKLIYSDAPGASPVQGERLRQEARAAAQIGNPAIVQVFDFGETDLGDPFVVMELLHGETLATKIRREARVPATRAVQILLPIADALGAAHGRGIVHRDVKPENIFLAVEGSGRTQPKLLDFGIARVGKTDSKLTLQGTVLGTPDYMSPEQARGETDVDERSDVWSLSVVLYELVTGRVPFDEENYNALLWAIINEEPRPSVELAAGDEELWDILERGLRKERSERWQSTHDLGRALASWLNAHGVTDDVTGTSVRAKWLDGAPNLGPGPASSQNLPTIPPPESTDRLATVAAPIRPAASHRRRWLGAGLIALLVALAVAVSFVQRAPADSGPPQTVAADPAPAPSPTRTAPAPAAPEIPELAVSSVQAATRPPRLAPRRPGAPRSVKPLPTTSAAPPPPSPSRPPSKAKDYDFGF